MMFEDKKRVSHHHVVFYKSYYTSRRKHFQQPRPSTVMKLLQTQQEPMEKLQLSQAVLPLHKLNKNKHPKTKR